MKKTRSKSIQKETIKAKEAKPTRATRSKSKLEVKRSSSELKAGSPSPRAKPKKVEIKQVKIEAEPPTKNPKRKNSLAKVIKQEAKSEKTEELPQQEAGALAKDEDTQMAEPLTATTPKTAAPVSSLFEFEQLVQQQFKSVQAIKNEQIAKREAAFSKPNFNFTPSRIGNRQQIKEEKTKLQTMPHHYMADGSKKFYLAADQDFLENEKTVNFIHRNDAAKRAGIVTAEKSHQKVTLANAAFGGVQTQDNLPRLEKTQERADLMNDENWYLQQQQEDGRRAYIPNKLPFVQKEPSPKQPENETTQTPDQPSVADLLKNQYGHEKDKFFLLQLPGTMPFQGLEPHDGKALLNLAPGSMGKLRVYRSGKVVMRFEKPDGTHVDLRLGKGICPGFAQELVWLAPEARELNFLAPISQKFVATPDLSHMFAQST